MRPSIADILAILGDTQLEIGTPPAFQRGAHNRHVCRHCHTKFQSGDAVCTLYEQQCYHQDCLEKAITRANYHPDDDETTNADTEDLTGRVSSEGESLETHPGRVSSEGVVSHSVELSSHIREYSAYPIQTRLKDGRPSIIIDPGSVGNLCGDKWAREVALMAKASGHKPRHQRRDRALQVSGVGNGSQQCNYDCDLPVAIRPKGQGRLQTGILRVPAVQDSDLPGLMGLTALKKNKAILDSNTLTLYFCGDTQYNLDQTLPKGTDKYQLETAPSGHLVLPCCEYREGSSNQDYSLTLMSAQPSTAVVQEQVREETQGRPSPPSRSPSTGAMASKIPPPPAQPAGLRRDRGRARSRSAQQSHQ